MTSKTPRLHCKSWKLPLRKRNVANLAVLDGDGRIQVCPKKRIHMITPNQSYCEDGIETIKSWGRVWILRGIRRHTGDGSEIRLTTWDVKTLKTMRDRIDTNLNPVRWISAINSTLHEKLVKGPSLLKKENREIDGSRRSGVEFSCHGPWYHFSTLRI